MKARLMTVAFGALLLSWLLPAADTVKVSREPLILATYQVGPPEKNPIFYSGRQYQGAKGPIYPYPLLDNLTNNRVERSWQAIRLENKYIRWPFCRTSILLRLNRFQRFSICGC